ncbi:PEP-CTERM putative exosortase interaction domain-containing protein [Rivularia sp. PCC 7116]|uniref:PEP-CTERM sorting domain-containing protein n=1 Tax=Rivularia sp. PCC 7116 TaxID=373994 RepID=UPI00029F212C|nr:PEP-CTERM sorting domain-containing protein [Rivularia sp. PCC 7116]AFY56447.1 PEP-CTERM putative exosortase interaction domain-containing protein [Rivularia sp. PCC 7116]
MLKKLFTIAAASTIATVAYANAAQAAGFNSITIGDKDGFGYGTGVDYQGAYGGDANIDGRGVLGVGDLLPDLNKDETLAKGSGDDFDNRSGMEKGNSLITGSGFVDNGSSGSKFTDISLSTTFIKTKKYNDNGRIKNNYNLEKKGFTQEEVKDSKVPLPGFNFDFSVAKGDIIKDTTMYFNMLFGDYDVKDAKVEFTNADGDTITKQLTKQKNNKGQDGLIQAAYVELNFAEIFSENANGDFDGYLEAKIIAPDEPYLAFDYAELSTDKVSFVQAQSVPEPTAILGFIAFGAYGAGSALKRKKKS